MNTSFKVRAQAKSKGEKIKSKTQDRGSGTKKKPRKAAGETKAKGSNGQPSTSNGASQPAEKVVYEPEAAGEDDHAFFDDEENADYAKFMVALDSSELTTFSKRAKDGVAVRLVSKKKKKQQQQPKAATVAAPQAVIPSLPILTDNSGGTTDAATDDVPTAAMEEEDPAAVLKPTPSATARKEAVVDAKRRKASTTGWAAEQSGPQRLPIKTRRGLLKPNERMQQSDPLPSENKGGVSPAAGGGSDDTAAAAAAAGDGSDSNGAKPEITTDDPASGGEEDAVSDGDESESVYDSAESDLEDYAMSEVDGHYGTGGPRMASAGGGGGGNVDLAVLKQRRFAQKKAQIAELCESILGAPQESLARPKTVQKGEDERSRMEQLFAMVRGGLLFAAIFFV